MHRHPQNMHKSCERSSHPCKGYDDFEDGCSQLRHQRHCPIHWDRHGRRQQATNNTKECPCSPRYLSTPRLKIHVEGKFTDVPSSSTVWYRTRNQLVRNLETAHADAEGTLCLDCWKLARAKGER